MPGYSTVYRHTDNRPLPALTVVDHPLCFPRFLAGHRQQFRSNPDRNITVNKLAESNGIQQASPLVVQKSIQDKVLYAHERQRIVDLLLAYSYTLDSTMMDKQVAEDWADLFTDDCVVVYPFGTHIGKAGLAQFALTAETRFKRMLHIASNFYVVFESDDVAHARYTCFATHGTHTSNISQHFMEGGYYYSSVRRERTNGGDQWKFSHLTLDMVWTQGDSLGLNEAR